MTHPRALVRLLATSVLIAALASPATAVAHGPTQEGMQRAGWVCSPEGGLPPGHCVSPGTGMNAAQGRFGSTWVLMVFGETGHFLGTETATTIQSADGRPCPHGDFGVWWSPGFGPTGDLLWVCHHH